MKTRSSALILGIGVFLCFGSPARAQLGDLGNAAKQGATDAAKQELMKQAGVPTAGAPAATPGAEPGAANAPAGEPTAAAPAAAAPDADTGAPDEPADE
jgi:hypothetical protein